MTPALRSYVVPRMFRDRREAGRLLGQALIAYAGTNALVLALPRGGVVVGEQVARVLGASLDVWVARKLGVPRWPEVGMGAIAEGPAVLLDRGLVGELGIRGPSILRVARAELQELRARVALFRGTRELPAIANRTVIVVDDGIATGATLRATLRAIRNRHPKRLVVAAPVAATDAADRLRQEVDELVCLHEPRELGAVGYWYEDFRQVSSEEVVRILSRSR